MRSLLTRLPVLGLILAACLSVFSSPAAADEMCGDHTEVLIDIRPTSEINKVNLSSQGLLPVAILSTDEFDASLFTLEAAHLSDASTAEGCAGATAVRWRLEDVNFDGRLDLVVFFRIQGLNFTTSTTEAMLMAHGTYNGMEIHIMGMDSVVVKE